MLHQQALLLRVFFADRHELALHVLRHSAAFIAQVIGLSAQTYGLESEIITPWNKIAWFLLNTEKFLSFNKRLDASTQSMYVSSGIKTKHTTSEFLDLCHWQRNLGLFV